MDAERIVKAAEHLSESEDQLWWYNDKTGEVAQGQQWLAAEAVGPFATREEAEKAPETLAERSRAWNEEDELND